jgi:hypothetical protein
MTGRNKVKKPNYSFEKYQRELAKKKKKEQKAASKVSSSAKPEAAPEEK